MKKENFLKALAALQRAMVPPPVEERDFAGIVKDFELVYEQAWKALKSHLEREGHEVRSARDAFKKAFQLGFLDEESVWLEMISDRNSAVHMYSEENALALYEKVRKLYLPELEKLASLIVSVQAVSRTT